jgi:hypothetical protein
MKIILLFALIAQAQAQSPSPTQNPSPTFTNTPTTTPMGSPMFTYSLTFPNSNPFAAMRADRIAYLIKAIACSANVPVELVYISYVRADYNYVAFKQETHTTTGLIQNCATLSITPSLRGLQFIVSTSSNALLEIYYLSPRRANPADPLFQVYASAILASASSASSGNFTELMQGQGQGQGQNQGQNGISGGGVAGLVIGLLAALGVISLATLVYIRRSRKQAQAQVQANQRMSIIDIKPNPKLQEIPKRKPSLALVKKVTLPTPIRK